MSELAGMASIVCLDVAKQGKTVLFGRRSEPVDPADSGWQFTCGGSDQSHFENAQIWAIEEVLAIEPTLEEFLELPLGTS